jgi:hypothetical protein
MSWRCKKYLKVIYFDRGRFCLFYFETIFGNLNNRFHVFTIDQCIDNKAVYMNMKLEKESDK